MARAVSLVWHRGHVCCVLEKVKANASDDATGAVKATQANGAALFLVSVWTGSPFVQMVWSTRWAPQGLMPVRPQVLTVHEFVLPSMQAVRISA